MKTEGLESLLFTSAQPRVYALDPADQYLEVIRKLLRQVESDDSALDMLGVWIRDLDVPDLGFTPERAKLLAENHGLPVWFFMWIDHVSFDRRDLAERALKSIRAGANLQDIFDRLNLARLEQMKKASTLGVGRGGQEIKDLIEEAKEAIRSGDDSNLAQVKAKAEVMVKRSRSPDRVNLLDGVAATVSLQGEEYFMSGLDNVGITREDEVRWFEEAAAKSAAS